MKEESEEVEGGRSSSPPAEDASSPRSGSGPEQSMQSRMEEYLSQMTEQYSAYQTLAAQAAITQQLRAASAASDSSQQALATQVALAQYVQQVQQANQAQNAGASNQYAQAQAMMQLLQGASGGMPP